MSAAPRAKTFAVEQEVLFRHCDPAGLVFYPRYFEMMNDLVEAFFARIGHPFPALHRDGAVPTVAIQAQFAHPSRLGDNLVLHLAPTRLGRTSLSLALSADCAGENRFSARSTLVNVGADRRPVPWPGPIRSAVSPYLGGP